MLTAQELISEIRSFRERKDPDLKFKHSLEANLFEFWENNPEQYQDMIKPYLGDEIFNIKIVQFYTPKEIFPRLMDLPFEFCWYVNIGKKPNDVNVHDVMEVLGWEFPNLYELRVRFWNDSRAEVPYFANWLRAHFNADLTDLVQRQSLDEYRATLRK